MLRDVKVKDWMTASVISVASDTPISVAHQIMKKNNVRRLPVIDNGELVGVITIGDVREASPSDATTLSIWELNYLWAQLTVDKVMSKRVITVTPETAIVEAARLMLENKISGIIVVNDAKEVMGVVTESDIFKMLVKMQG